MALMEISTVIGCPNQCQYCPQDLIVKKYRDRSVEAVMTMETFGSCLDKLPLDVDIVFAGMSEPWSNPFCTEMLLRAHHKGHCIGVFTSLVGMSVEDVEAISRISFKKFIVHLPSTGDQEDMRVGGNYQDVLSALMKSPVKATFVYHGEEIHPAVKSLLRRKPFRVANITRAGNILPQNCQPPVRRNGRIFCAQNLRRNNLLPNGDVVLCCMDFGLRHVLGNLLISSYEDLFRSEGLNCVRRGLMGPSVETLCRCCERAFEGKGVLRKACSWGKDIGFDLMHVRTGVTVRRFWTRLRNSSSYFSDLPY